MTKAVRIENADQNNAVGIKLKVQQKVYDTQTLEYKDEWVDTGETFYLSYPTMQIQNYITNSRRLIIEEYIKQ